MCIYIYICIKITRDELLLFSRFRLTRIFPQYFYNDRVINHITYIILFASG